MEIHWACLGLVIGAVSMFTIMLIRMYQQIKFSLDLIRHTVATIVLLILSFHFNWQPKVISYTLAVEMLALASLIVGVVILALLWRNPATHRLLNVKLREN
jgi:NADH:ubiquinone oxidoreductase subunit K